MMVMSKGELTCLSAFMIFSNSDQDCIFHDFCTWSRNFPSIKQSFQTYFTFNGLNPHHSFSRRLQYRRSGRSQCIHTANAIDIKTQPVSGPWSTYKPLTSTQIPSIIAQARVSAAKDPKRDCHVCRKALSWGSKVY